MQKLYRVITRAELLQGYKRLVPIDILDGIDETVPPAVLPVDTVHCEYNVLCDCGDGTYIVEDHPYAV